MRDGYDDRSIAADMYRRADLDWAVWVALGEIPVRRDLDWAVAVAFEGKDTA